MNKYHDHTQTLVLHVVSGLLVQVGMKMSLVIKIARLRKKNADFLNPINDSCYSRDRPIRDGDCP